MSDSQLRPIPGRVKEGVQVFCLIKIADRLRRFSEIGIEIAESGTNHRAVWILLERGQIMMLGQIERTAKQVGEAEDGLASVVAFV